MTIALAQRFRHRQGLPGRRAVLRWGAGLVVGIVLVAVMTSVAGGLGDAGRALRRVQPEWVVAASGCEIVAYLLIGAHLHRLARASATISRSLALGLAFVIAGFGLLTPAAPAEGLAIAGRQLRKRGFDQRRTVLTLGLAQWFAARIFVLLAAADVVVAVTVGDLPAVDFVPLLAVATAALLALVLTQRLAGRTTSGERAAVLLGALRLGRPLVPAAERRAAGAAWHQEAMAIVGSPANRVVLAGLAAGALLADMGCLWTSLAAVGVHVRGDVAILAAAVGVLATLVPFLPGGLGLVEAAIPAVLHHFGAPLDAALAGAIVYRAVGTFLPAGVGAVIVAGLTLRHRRG